MIAFWGVRVYKNVFPDYQSQFGIINAVSLIVLNSISIYSSSFIADRYEERYPQTKGKSSRLNTSFSFYGRYRLTNSVSVNTDGVYYYK